MQYSTKDKKKYQFQLGLEVLKIARKFPKHIALEIEERKFNYQELAQYAKKIAKSLEGNAQKYIGILTANTFETYAGILGILISGKAYVPVKPDLPENRIKVLLERLKIKTILCHIPSEKILQISPDTKQLSYDLIKVNRIVTRKTITSRLNRTAYVLSTSGSSGIPKLVPISHSNLEAFFKFFLKEYDFVNHDTFLQPYELNFDVSVFSVFMPWLTGGRSVIVPEKGFKHFEIVKTIIRSKTTVLSMVPGVLESLKNNFKELNFPSVRLSFFSGDSLHIDLVEKWKACIPNAEVHNFYGPTETTIVCSRYKIENENIENYHQIVSIGKCFPKSEMAILNKNKITQKANQEGEIIIRGEQVFKSYLGEDKTKGFIKIGNKKWYQSGDKGMKNENGNFLFLGRMDRQVKINGYRIEPAEIENIVRKKFKIRSVVFKNQKKQNELCLAIECKKKINESLIREQLASKLPSYMIPNKIITMNKFPLNSNGKIDFRKIKGEL